MPTYYSALNFWCLLFPSGSKNQRAGVRKQSGHFRILPSPNSVSGNKALGTAFHAGRTGPGNGSIHASHSLLGAVVFARQKISGPDNGPPRIKK
jgi:hypothetical protein